MTTGQFIAVKEYQKMQDPRNYPSAPPGSEPPPPYQSVPPLQPGPNPPMPGFTNAATQQGISPYPENQFQAGYPPPQGGYPAPPPAGFQPPPPGGYQQPYPNQSYQQPPYPGYGYQQPPYPGMAAPAQTVYVQEKRRDNAETDAMKDCCLCALCMALCCFCLSD